MPTADRSPVVRAYEDLCAADPVCYVEVGRPDGPGWIAGADLRVAHDGPFHALLLRIGECARTTDRRTIAASFALRFGWSSAMAIAPYLRARCVPDIALGNTSFRFRASTFFEFAAVHEPRGWLVTGDARVGHSSMGAVADGNALRDVLRRALTAQAAPVVDALYRWSGFSPRGTWGMLTSAWVSQFATHAEPHDDQRALTPELDAFFAGDDLVAAMQPRLHAVSVGGATHLFQRRGSCCRLYLLPGGGLCASCPLVGDTERLARNREWMASELARRGPLPGHG
ncbi:MAG: (2Fe-2S)-binding protein [Vicinamibacteraceae bacterium]